MVSLSPNANRFQRLSQAAWALVFALILGLCIFLRPSPTGHGTHTQLGLPPCPSVLLFSRPCPGCGMTTSFTNLVHGRVIEAFRVHPFGPVLFLGWALSAVAAGYGALRGLRLDTSSRAFNWVMAAFAVTFFAFGAFRFATGFAEDNLGTWSLQQARR